MICVNRVHTPFLLNDNFVNNSYGIYETNNFLGPDSPHLIVGNSLNNYPELAIYLEDNGVELTDVILHFGTTQ